MITRDFNTQIGEVENKILDHAKYITTQEFKKLTAENFAGRLKQAEKKVALNEKKYLEYFRSDNGSQNIFLYQATLDKVELKLTKVLIIFLVGNQSEYIILNSSHHILLSI